MCLRTKCLGKLVGLKERNGEKCMKRVSWLYLSPHFIRAKDKNWIKFKSVMLSWEWHVARMGEREQHTGFWRGIVKEWMPLEGPRGIWQDNIKMGREERGRHGMDWAHLTRDSGGLMWTEEWTLEFRQIRRISRLAEELLASQGLRTTHLARSLAY